VAAEYRKRFVGREGVLFIGKAQEKARVFRTQKRRNPQTGATFPWLVPSTAMVNQFYIYAIDEDFGPFFLKFCSYFLLAVSPNLLAQVDLQKARP
jgi:hypothetical protein